MTEFEVAGAFEISSHPPSGGLRGFIDHTLPMAERDEVTRPRSPDPLPT